MIATWITHAGRNHPPRGLNFRNSRCDGAESARCAAPRLSAPGRDSQPGGSLSARLPRQRIPSFFRRPEATRAAARTCSRAVSFRPGCAGAAVALAALIFPLPAAAHLEGGVSATGRAELPECGESDTICAAYSLALKGLPASTLPGPAFSPGGFSSLSGPAGGQHRASGKNEFRYLGLLRAGLRHGRRPC